MEKGKAASEGITDSIKKLNLNSKTHPPSRFRRLKNQPPSLVSLCLEVVGLNLEDILPDLPQIASGFPPHIKMAIAAISRRRKLLNDDVIVTLADTSWEILDVSGSDVSDSGLIQVAQICSSLRAVDISRCSNVTAAGVSELIRHCKSLQTLRCGGCPRSDHTARNCLCLLKPKLNDVEGDSWEEFDAAEIDYGAESLRWLVWPKIDKNSLETLTNECPRILVNPKSSPLGFRGVQIPREAMSDNTLDELIVKDINPKTWATCGLRPKPVVPCIPNSTELSMAEKFRLAFVERDTRLAPKRAKNARQHQRRAEREWMMMDTTAKAVALASKASKKL
ncbi:RNI-like superfamily protein [Euphorbia peplus]|nr:RNI-like superfamily protein [Euphorbia peplus]